MKIDRLIGIITVLQQKGKVTAPYLAEKFEVSRRTIIRDIDDICRAGIPIVTTQGTNGGISIMDGFNINTTIFTKEELQAIFVGLKSLDSISYSNKYKTLTEKICGSIPVADNMIIDLSSFYKDSLSQKIEQIRTAIAEHRMISFHYYYSKGETDITIEPALIIFKWSSWYVFGFSIDQNDFRMYKLNRLWDSQVIDEYFTPKEIPEEKLNFGSNMTDDKIIKAIYEPSEKYRLIEDYGPDSFTTLSDGRLYSELGFTNYDRALNWFIPFLDKVTIIAPDDFKNMLVEEAKKY